MERMAVPGHWIVLTLFFLPCLLLLWVDSRGWKGIRYEVMTHVGDNFTISVSSSKQRPVDVTLRTAGKDEEMELAERDRGADDACAGRYIYIHDDLPSKFNDDLVERCRELIKWFDMCPYVVNSGLGPRIRGHDSKRVLSNTRSWFLTNQFTLEMIFRERMEKYECRTRDSLLASAVYVPFYPGFDMGRHLWGYNTSVRDELINDLVKWLESRPEWRRMHGLDHFLVAGRVGWDFIRTSDNDSDWGNKLMSLPQLKNTTLLTIEATAWTNQLAIPYPTYFHPCTRSEVLRWQKKVMKQTKRKYLYAFVGAPRPEMKHSIRSEIMNRCLRSQGKCRLLNCLAPGNECENPVKVMEAFRDSVFCLQPPGDSLTRRSIFDSILAGCIPVFFDPGSAYTQYIWHFPKNHTKYSVFIPGKDVKEQAVDIEEVLKRFTKKEVVDMRAQVVDIIPKIVYGKSGCEKIGDAFDIAVGGVLERVERVKREMEEGRDINAWFSQWSWELKVGGMYEKWKNFF